MRTFFFNNPHLTLKRDSRTGLRHNVCLLEDIHQMPPLKINKATTGAESCRTEIVMERIPDGHEQLRNTFVKRINNIINVGFPRHHYRIMKNQTNHLLEDSRRVTNLWNRFATTRAAQDFHEQKH